MENEKGCVYFFKHVGLSPIKIGYSKNESPIKRFEQFKTYAPFGAELVGFIMSSSPKDLETQLHDKYSRDRIKGEWFEINEEEAIKCINFYSNLEDIEEKNSFQIEWAKKKMPINEKANVFIPNFSDTFSFEFKKEFKKVFLNQTEISNYLKCNKSLIRMFFIQENIKQTTQRVDGKVKSCYALYMKM